jgi:hypothetical protein
MIGPAIESSFDLNAFGIGSPGSRRRSSGGLQSLVGSARRTIFSDQSGHSKSACKPSFEGQIAVRKADPTRPSNPKRGQAQAESSSRPHSLGKGDRHRPSLQAAHIPWETGTGTGRVFKPPTFLGKGGQAQAESSSRPHSLGKGDRHRPSLQAAHIPWERGTGTGRVQPEPVPVSRRLMENETPVLAIHGQLSSGLLDG